MILANHLIIKKVPIKNPKSEIAEDLLRRCNPIPDGAIQGLAEDACDASTTIVEGVIQHHLEKLSECLINKKKN